MSDKKKIAYLSTFYPFRGGIAQFNALMYRAFQDKGHDIEAFTFKRQYPNFLFPGETQYVTDDDKVDEIDSKELLDTVNPFSYYKTARAINKYAPDILLTKYWMTFFGPSLGLVAKKMKPGVKCISVLDNVIPHEKRFFDKPANNYFLKNNDGFIVMSDAVLADLLSLKPDAKYLRIDHPVYDHFGEKREAKASRKKLGMPEEGKFVLFFGFIREYKGLDLLIQAMKSVGDDVHLIVAGETYGSFDNYQKLIDESPAKGRIHLHNRYISDDEVSDFFSASNVCILPYKSATQSGITAISHHFDLPIIATDVGGLKESIHHDVNGLIVKSPEVQLISDSINDYFARNVQETFAEQIRKEKEENSWDNFADKIIKFAETI